MRIINVVGARPNFVKIAPLIRAMSAEPALTPILVHTGQSLDHPPARHGLPPLWDGQAAVRIVNILRETFEGSSRA
jgi:UDP-N-acetylglucosamine 2-epimerase